MSRQFKEFTFIGIIILFISGCGVYSFTGASIPPEAKTVSIQYFSNKADLVEPTLSQTLTDALRDKFASQTTLDLVYQGGDLQLEGEITEYSTKPTANQGGEVQQGALNRLTITVKVIFVNLFDESKNFETSFSRYDDYPSSANLNDEKDGLIESINEALVEDIFNQAVVNW